MKNKMVEKKMIRVIGAVNPTNHVKRGIRQAPFLLWKLREEQLYKFFGWKK